ncbi:MAG: hypothetical protein CVU09_00340 [Bacteroidetes bacterium HGW-Bacteroidetes-4]|jgi:hypothetical protein|nr:MAG: hypothetical protein CVU09_00340 [Bacteroidetes bacterium HGW-Bacteroidetes-4]
MQIEKLNIDKLPESGIIKIFTGKGLDEKEPKKLDNIEGAIGTPFEFLSKRKDLESVNLNESHVEFNLEKFNIILILNESSHYSNRVVGRMIETKTLNDLQINTGKRWDCFELADFFRLNRSIFLNATDGPKLVTLLNNFKAKVDKELEQNKDNRANYNLQRRQVVESNLPESFKLRLQLFKGQEPVDINVEVDIDPASLECVLISPELADILQTSVRDIINEQLDKIKELCPELPIIEL